MHCNTTKNYQVVGHVQHIVSQLTTVVTGQWVMGLAISPHLACSQAGGWDDRGSAAAFYNSPGRAASRFHAMSGPSYGVPLKCADLLPERKNTGVASIERY